MWKRDLENATRTEKENHNRNKTKTSDASERKHKKNLMKFLWKTENF